MKKSYKLSKKLLLIFGLLVAFGLLELVLIVSKLNDTEPSQQAQNSSNSNKTEDSQPAAATFNKKLHPLGEANSVWVIVNKGRVLARDYVPANLVVPNVPLRDSPSSSNMHLRSDAATALEELFNAAAAESIKLKLASGYRSYATQSSVYNGYVRSDGTAGADAYSARPGHSEHQTGLAADVAPTSLKCSIDPCFADTPEGQWLATTAYKYGFVVRYPKDLKNLTGYEYEPWHIRYVGKQLSAEVQKSGQILEQFFGLATYPTYPDQIYKLK